MSSDHGMILPAAAPEAETNRGTAPNGSQGYCDQCQQPFTRRVHAGPNRQRFCSEGCRVEWHRKDGDPAEPGLYVGKVFHVSLRNANVRAKSVKGGWKYELVAEMAPDDFDLFNGHDLTGSCFEAQIETVEVAQLPLIEPEKPPEKPKGGPLSIEAAKKCREPIFQQFCSELYSKWDEADAEECARELILERCGIGSRADLDHNPVAAAKFKTLMVEFRDWNAGHRYA